MNVETIPLNLARKWRSKNFDELIGQDLSLRLIKNSLFKNLIFPVYLFSGTKGCGKTSTARLFASALNCTELSNFQKNPQVVMPCLICKSCAAMQKFQHPDIIEIDAASHTGVDNIRTIIENASFVPILGNKKIYIIDEAHMLSKAAFNALLKILEEPPTSVVFMLATTDAPKILDTVRSRCFQLFFYPISVDSQTKQLELICKEENIPFDGEGLIAIAKNSEGSMRDAINIMERVRLAYGEVNKKAVFDTIGYLDDEYINSIILAVLEQSTDRVLQLSSKINIERYNIILIWKKIVDTIQKALMNPTTLNCSTSKLLNLFEICCAHEFALSKSSTPIYALQVMLIKMCKDDVEIKNNVKLVVEKLPSSVPIKKMAEPIMAEPIMAEPIMAEPFNENKDNKLWVQFLEELEKLDDPLVTSVFKQGIFKQFNEEQKLIEISFGNDLVFFKDLLENAKSLWMPIIKKKFGEDIKLISNFEENPKKKKIEPTKQLDKIVQVSEIKSGSINLSDSKTWPTANMLVKIFPGTITNSAENYE